MLVICTHFYSEGQCYFYTLCHDKLLFPLLMEGGHPEMVDVGRWHCLWNAVSDRRGRNARSRRLGGGDLSQLVGWAVKIH